MKITKFKNKYSKQIIVAWVAIRFLVGFLLIISAIRMYASIKLDFELMLNGLRIPKHLINIVWLLLPWAKLYVGGFLILGIFTQVSALLSAGFHCVAILVLIYIKTSGIKIYSSPCSIVSYGNCGKALIFNISLIILSVIIYAFHTDKFTFDSWVKRQE
jgi:uncharacterized membrane protein YphA (DoxX/SURF4 family)